MKYKLLILSLFVSIVGFSQVQSFVIVRNDSMFAVWVIGGDSTFKHLPSGTPVPIAITGFVIDTMRNNVYDRIMTLIANNSTAAGRNLLNVQPGGSAEFLGLNNNTVLQRTVPQVKQDLSLENVNNTSDANKPISTATQTALNTKTTYHTGLDAGANDSYVVTLSPVPTSLTTGMIVIFRANTANTTGCTINVNGLGVTNIVKRVSTTPATGDILAQMFCMLVYNGTNFVILNPVVN